MNLLLPVFVYLVTTLTAFNVYAQRIGSHDEKWTLIRTPHFEIITRTDQLDLGRYYAQTAEQSYRDLATIFNTLTERVVIVINDTTDISNGYATRIPYPHVMVFSVQNGDHDWLAENGNWPQLLVTHELTHIYQFEPASGFYKLLRPIFGNIIAPNMLMPTWWKEGMAVELETQFSTTGRLRSVFQDASLRAITLENKLKKFDLPQANETLPSWPYGVRPYLFGSLFFSQLVKDTKNIKSINALSERHGERVPYFVEEPMRELTGGSYESTYNRGLIAAEQNAIQQAKMLRQSPLSEISYVDKKALATLRPTFSAAHQLLAYLEQTEDEMKIVITDLNGNKKEFKKLPAGQIQSLVFHPTEKKILYSKIDAIDAGHTFSDLYEYDLGTDKSERITKAARARAASYSIDGKKIIFLATPEGRTQIHILDRDTKQTTLIADSGLSDRFESPIFWDEDTVLAAKMDSQGTYQLIKIDVTTQAITTTALQAKQLRFLKKINQALYFVSSQNGVNNIYKSEDLATASPVTHVSTGIWSFDIQPEEQSAWVSLMTGSGFKVTRVHLQKREEALPVIQNRIAERYSNRSLSAQNPNYLTSNPIEGAVEEDYSAGQYLWPSYWIPFVATNSSSQGVFFQAQTSGHDPLKIHQYSLILSYDSELNKTQFNGSYLNSAYSLPFKLESIVRSFAIGSFRDVVETTTHSVSVLPNLFAINRRLISEIGMQLQTVTFGQTTEHYGPYASIAYVDYSKNIFQISPTQGWGINFRYEKLLKSKDETQIIARDYDKAQLTYVGFFSEWLPDHHAIKTRLSGHAIFQSVFGRYGTSSFAQFFDEDSLTHQFVTRGYSPAQFYGRNIWNANLEYRFPISNVERGSGTDAYYFKRLSGAVVTDALGVDGFGLDKDLILQSLTTDKAIISSGLEMKLESTIGYVLPMNFILGYYWPYEKQYASSSIGLSLQIGNFF